LDPPLIPRISARFTPRCIVVAGCCHFIGTPCVPGSVMEVLGAGLVWLGDVMI